ncbi:16S rRNA (cytosine(1402)-N(4))-methyltransferase RsmH [Aromatoleum aromaticum]|uniref:Ribosomal RNA small subunit methyltransferase H n=1 Tax=Aromatoleum aromaticum (strain DSM 19018 / LMG 30748 / EbN1) TaxID=76114 RepID=RSMH_AROAE|nr:16S rRNA (cytosine(1402)-N(4))-methyltransferase RsmH [Aromatoleum aromaticum]Q5P6Y9.1 RecName: Full=Ribosomal RNA small subunit methyltransferase H; AltName: Full=16S rRNA m(4)C1402 methyltransferase; AltName: Full=rRNA (cytosine-N(4)-)-methyltransferase RsmH [Aromatoleum aromaticum EbN1]NMG54248.1 16S rRNA (cytosine(1402)-N(4))-methyltransferase RsmH [Aromatoleum aromaticum]CAI06922.1 S-adenosyl-methyltransferase mraW [Aromatoleum aromaticum EbN1]
MSAAPQHVTVLLAEAVEALAIRPGGVYVDGTFGRGGHSRAILAKLDADGRLIAFDRDPRAIEVARALPDPRLTAVHAPFSAFAEELDRLGLEHVDGVLLDLGVSSPQLDEAARGMSFRFDAPLDMRMDTSRGQTVAQWLADASVAQITEVLRDYGEERFAYAIAKAIAAARAGGAVASTRQLAEIVEKAVRTREPGQHPATRSFQALRIFINQELEELSLVLPAAVERLKPGGRLVAISFHSLEDRIVKRFMRDESRPPQLPSRLPLRAAELPQPRLRLVGKSQRPGPGEVAANPRSRSAVMRVAERTGGAA